MPLIFNLRMDPYERAQITSNTYYAWSMHKLYRLIGAQAIVAEFVATLQGLSAAAEAAELQSRSGHAATVASGAERLIIVAYLRLKIGAKWKFSEAVAVK